MERGVFQKLSLQEMSEYKGPLNYITMVEALKNSPYTTTPLRICMKSLNDSMMKGPLALVDLFMVTLGM